MAVEKRVLGKRTVLVVEDNALLRHLVASSLEQRDFAVEAVGTAAEAKRAFDLGDHDVLVLDIDLGPGPNGFDVAQALLAKAPHTAVVFLTNLPDSRFAERDARGLPTGFAYLRKTNLADVEPLVHALDAALRGANMGQFRHDRDPQRPLAALTTKQIAVLKLASQGMTNAQIAEERGVSPKAIEDTIRRACLALGLSAEREGNVRVAAVRRYLEVTGGVRDSAEGAVAES